MRRAIGIVPGDRRVGRNRDAFGTEQEIRNAHHARARRRSAAICPGTVPLRPASEITKSCPSCGLWHWKHAL